MGRRAERQDAGSTPARRRPSPSDTRADDVVAGLVGSGLVDPARVDEARAVVRQTLQGPAQETPVRRRLAEVAGYVGGALLVAAVVVFLVEEWGSLPLAGRVGTLAALAAVLFGGAVTTATLGRRRPAGLVEDAGVRRRLASALACGGAVALASAVGVVVADVSPPFSDRPWVAGGVAALVAAAAGYRLAPSALGQVTMVLSAATAISTALDEYVSGTSDVPLSLALLGLGVVWVLLAERGVLLERYAGLAFGCGLMLLGAQLPTFGSDQEWLGYLLTAVLSAATVGLYLRTRAVPYLVTAVAGITLAVPEALLDWTDGALGPVGVLLATGVTLLVAGLLGLRLRQGVGAEPPTPPRAAP